MQVNSIVTKVQTADHNAAVMQVANAPSGGCACGTAHEVNDGTCKVHAGEFPRFFAGQLVQPDDLTAIEKRVFFHEQLRARHLFGWGIACGFRVGLDGQRAGTFNNAGAPTGGGIAVAGATVRVEAGYGIDRYGRDVYLPKDRSISLETLFAEREERIKKAMGDPWCVIPGCTPTPPTHYCIAVRYKECPEKPVPSYAQQCGTPKTICEYSRVREDVEIRLFGDNEFPGTTQQQPQPAAWCGIPAGSEGLAALFTALMQFPDALSTQPRPDYAALAANVGGGSDCDDLLHLARPCDPCVDSPWIPIACFTRTGDAVSAPDCGVRRVLYSLQEIEAVLVRLFCKLFRSDTIVGVPVLVRQDPQPPA